MGHVRDGVDRARRVRIETEPFESILIRGLGPDVVRVVEAVEPHPVADRAVLRHLRLRPHHGMRHDCAVGNLRARADQRRADDGRALADAGAGVNDDRSEDPGARRDRVAFAHQERRGPPRRPPVARLLDHVVLRRGEQPVRRRQVDGTALDGDIPARCSARRRVAGAVRPAILERVRDSRSCSSTGTRLAGTPAMNGQVAGS